MNSAPAWSAADIRLVVTDMDGTLLDAEGRIPGELWPLIERMRGRGAVFAPASGRQYATLHAMFSDSVDDLVYIAENGTLVMREGRELSSSTIATGLVEEVVREVRTLDNLDLGVVLAGKKSAYIERVDPAFADTAAIYCASLTPVEDLLNTGDEIVKIAVYDFGNAETGAYPALRHFADRAQVVVSNRHWLDLMAPGSNKGTAVRSLQERLGVGPEHTMVFGDYLNDLEMMSVAEWSFAMGNAHPEVAAAASYRAPANTENGVIEVLRTAFPPAPA